MAKYIELNNEIMQKDTTGFYSLSKDIEAVEEFKKHVVGKTKKFKSIKERFEWLIKNNYYIDFFKLYTLEEIEELSKLVYDYNFEFKSYMAISKFYQSYSLKTDDKSQYLETYEDRIIAVSLYLAQGKIDMALDLAKSMIEQRYQPATPTFLNSGRTRRGELISCFLLSCDDSLNSINQMIGTCGQLSKIGGGVAVNLSNLRARGEEIKEIKNSASGVMPVAKLLEDTFSYVNQLGQRNGAGVAYLNIFHYDIEEFLDSKKINASEKSRLQTLSIGLIVPDKFMELAEKGEDYYAFAPHSVYKETGLRFDEINIEKEYDNLVSNPNIIKKKLNPRKMLTKIAKIQFESGYPYMMYSGNANKVHALKDIGDIKMSNLCVTGDTRLHTDKGLITAKELYETQQNFNVTIDTRTKDMKIGSKGTETVSAIPMQLTARSADVYKISTQHGYEIKATEWHKFYRDVNGEIEKISLNELKLGDKLLVQSGNGNYGEFSDKDLAFVSGVIAGDGCITKTNAIIYLYGEKAILKDILEEKVSKLIKKYKRRSYQHNASFEPKFTYNEKKDSWALRSAILLDILNDFNVTKETKTVVPDFIFKGTRDVVSAYLSGLYQIDGAVNASPKYKAMSYELISIDEKLVKGLQILFANEGIFSTIYSYDDCDRLMPDGKGEKEIYHTKCRYKISIQDRKSRDRFNSLVTLKDIDEKKVKAFNSILQPKSRMPKHNYTTTITSIDFIGKEDVYDTTQPKYHSLIFNGIVTGNCSEIFQLQETSVINDYGIDDIIKRDICCNLGSLNIANVMELKNIKGSVYSGIDALTSVADLSSIANAPTIKKANDELKSVGLGAMNLHGYLAKNHIDYESKDAIEFVDKFFMMVNYYSIKRSMEIAKERNKAFKDFESSEYAKGTYFDKYINEDYTQFTNRNVAELFKGIYIPTQENWRQLSKEVKKYGMYHAYRLAIAPTQSIAYIQNATPSVMPITDVIERRTYGDSTTYYPMPYLSKETTNYYLPAYYMEMSNLIDLISAMQKHIDQGISMTLFVDSNTTTRELARLYIYAYKKGLKSIYYTRNKNIAFGECETCSI